jgi:8-oxo-dGTP diphosphatase
METPHEAVVREVLEETGLLVERPPYPITFQNVLMPEEDHHYVTLFFEVSHFSGEVKNTEPDKCDGWEWFIPEEIPEPRFGGLDAAIRHWCAMRDSI